MFAVFRKDVKSYFYSPIAYVLIAVFLIINSVFYTFGNLFGGNANFSIVLSNSIFFLLFLIPILTMKSLSEERKNETEVLLLTSPVSLTSIILGKFFAAYFVFLVMTVITFIYPIILVALGGQITAQIISAYIGFILLGSALISVGLFASSLTENQIVSAITGVVLLFLMYLASALSSVIGGLGGKILNWFSIMERFTEFSNGILAVSPIVYFISFTAVFLFLTSRVIERKRWSQG